MFSPYSSNNVGYSPQGIIAREVDSSYQSYVKVGQKAARERLHTYQAAYAGEYDITLPEKIAFELKDLGIKTNLAKPVVDAMCAKLDLKSVTSTDEATQALLDEEYARNIVDEESTAIHKEAAVNGDAYVLVWPEYGPDGQPTKHSVIRLLQTEDIDLTYDERDLLKAVECKRMWNETLADGKTRVRKDTITAEFIYREYSDEGTNSEWRDYVEDGLPPLVPNPLHTIPVVHFKAERDARNRPFGISQLEAGLPIIADINALVKDAMIKAYYASGRQLVVSGVNSEAFLKKNPAGLDRSAFAAHMWGDPAVKEFAIPGDDMTGLLALLQARIKHLAIVTRTPLQYLEAGVQTALSGIALQQLEGALSDKVKEAQTLLGSSYRRMFSLAMLACGQPNADIAIGWEQPYAQDTTLQDQEEYKLGLVTAKEYHMRRGMTEEAAQALVDDIEKEKDAQTEQLFGNTKPAPLQPDAAHLP
jgi:hypothetical protein